MCIKPFIFECNKILRSFISREIYSFLYLLVYINIFGPRTRDNRDGKNQTLQSVTGRGNVKTKQIVYIDIYITNYYKTNKQVHILKQKTLHIKTININNKKENGSIQLYHLRRRMRYRCK